MGTVQLILAWLLVVRLDLAENDHRREVPSSPHLIAQSFLSASSHALGGLAAIFVSSARSRSRGKKEFLSPGAGEGGVESTSRPAAKPLSCLLNHLPQPGLPAHKGGFAVRRQWLRSAGEEEKEGDRSVSLCQGRS